MDNYDSPYRKRNRTNGWDVANLILGILGFLTSIGFACCLPVISIIAGAISIIGIILGVVGLMNRGNKPMGIIGIILNSLTVLIGVAALILCIAVGGILVSPDFQEGFIEGFEDAMEDYEDDYDYDYDYYY